MKFKTYLMENESGSLIGKTINGSKITEKTKTEHWDSSFYCDDKQLTSLIGAPASVGGSFYCDGNQLTSLVGAPTSVDGSFFCDKNQLTTLVGAPASVGGSFYCDGNQLTSLRGVHKEIKTATAFYCSGNPIKEAVLGLLLINGLKKVDGLPCDQIINKYLPNKTGMESVSRCQDELEEAGYGDFAEL